MEHQQLRTFDIGAWLRKASRHPHLVGRDLGQRCRDAMEQAVRLMPPETVMSLDCSNIEIMDFTGADECLAKLMTRVVAWEYGDLYIVLVGLDDALEGNLIPALDRRNVAMVVQRKEWPAIIGPLNPYLQNVYRLLTVDRVMTARDWADSSGEAMTLAATKLLTLYKARLVQRVSKRLPAGGREYVYHLVEGTLPESRTAQPSVKRKKG